jgi:predicted nucleotidyltransferase component of viral defense system
MQPAFYTTNLYPLQDRVLRIGEQINTKFYLTGGTALSRAWLQHRYSDDLDFFLNNDAAFSEEVNKMLQGLTAQFGQKLQRLIDTSGFHRWVITDEDIHLKVEFVNDVDFRKGAPVKTTLFYQTDTVENIASNKISALSRNEPKDMADLLFIEKHYAPHWPAIIQDAKEKEISVNEVEVASTLGTYKVELLKNVRWTNAPDLKLCENLLSGMAEKILRA